MEARIIFDLESPEDKKAFELYGQINNMASALFEISHNLKKKLHYQFEGDDNGAIDLVFEKISEILEDNNVILDKLD